MTQRSLVIKLVFLKMMTQLVGVESTGLWYQQLEGLPTEYHNSAPQLFEHERKTIHTLVAEQMYYGLIFPSDKQYKTIPKELTATCFIA